MYFLFYCNKDVLCKARKRSVGDNLKLFYCRAVVHAGSCSFLRAGELQVADPCTKEKNKNSHPLNKKSPNYKCFSRPLLPCCKA